MVTITEPLGYYLLHLAEEDKDNIEWKIKQLRRGRNDNELRSISSF